MATFEDFLKLDIRVGKVINVEDFPEARNPSYKMTIDFGEEVGIKVSAGQYPANYAKDELLNQFVLGVVNFPPRQIGPISSEVLVLGLPDEKHNAVFVTPERPVLIGGRLF